MIGTQQDVDITLYGLNIVSGKEIINLHISHLCSFKLLHL